MANTVTAIKRVRITERRTAINKMRRTRLRHQIRAVRRAIQAHDAASAAKLLPETFSLVDRAAKWGVIKKNTAARYKSRLTLRVRKMTAAA
jgi:small subunit ribosomal protein S20